MELRRFVGIIWRRLWLVVLATLVVGATTYALSVTSPRIYQAAATLEINYGADPRSDAYASQLASQRSAATYVEQLRSTPLAREVANALGANLTPGVVLGMTAVQQVRDTGLVRVSAESSDPVLAQRVANKVAEVFIVQTAAKQQARYESAKRDLDLQITDLEKQIADAQKAIAPLGDPADPRSVNIPEFARLERTRLATQLSNYQTRYVILLKSAEDFRLAAAQNSDNIAISAPADVPRSPIRPQTTLNVMLGLIAGLVLGMATTFLLEYLDDTVKGPDELESEMKLTTLGVISRMRGVKQPGDVLVTSGDGKSATSEAYRVLRTNFQFSGLANPQPALVVTSTWPSEGKSTTLANLGIVLAQTGKRVILVDSDLRRPSLHKLFGIPKEPGLTNLLLDPGVGLAQALVQTEIDGLRLLPCGAIPPNPAEILASPQMLQMIKTLQEQADVVLFDSPPVLSVADSTVLAAATGNVLLVVSAGVTRTSAVSQARDALLRANARILGVVLNKVDADRGGYYYYYHRYYHYYDENGSNGKLKEPKRIKKDAKR